MLYLGHAMTFYYGKLKEVGRRYRQRVKEKINIEWVRQIKWIFAAFYCFMIFTELTVKRIEGKKLIYPFSGDFGQWKMRMKITPTFWIITDFTRKFIHFCFYNKDIFQSKFYHVSYKLKLKIYIFTEWHSNCPFSFLFFFSSFFFRSISWGRTQNWRWDAGLFSWFIGFQWNSKTVHIPCRIAIQIWYLDG